MRFPPLLLSWPSSSVRFSLSDEKDAEGDGDKEVRVDLRRDKAGVAEAGAAAVKAVSASSKICGELRLRGIMDVSGEILEDGASTREKAVPRLSVCWMRRVL